VSPARTPPTADGWGVDGVTVRLGSRVALDDVGLEAWPGQVTGVVGGDGAGKTTLLRCLVGLQPIEAGSVRRPDAHRIGAMPATSGTWPELSVDENIAFAAHAYRVDRSAAAGRIEDLLERTGLAPFRTRLAGHLSGGMRHKLGVVCAVAHAPDLLVLDEPTTGVDPVSRADLWSLLAGEAARGAAVVFATTYLDEAERATRLVVLDRGRSLADDAPSAIAASVPGRIVVVPEQPAGPDAARAWRRRGAWRVWRPDAAAADHDTPALDDAVIALSLAADDKTGDAGGVADAPNARAGGEDQTEVDADGADRTIVAPAILTDGADTAPRLPGDAAPAARAAHVTRRFGGFVAVDDVDLEVRPGEVVGLIGANGAGKTTLIRMLLGLVRPSGGQVALFGAPPSRATRQRLGYVPQGLSLYADMTPTENLAFSRAVFGGHATGGPAPEFPDVPAGRLPLGLQRRLAFAAVLERYPELLVLDEPTSGVDPLARARLWETIGAAAADGAAVLVTTHDMDEASECDRLVMLAAARIVAQGTPDEVVGGAKVVEVDADDWTEVFHALAAAGLQVSLAGRTVRVAGTDEDTVHRALGRRAAQVRTVPATLAERFSQIVADAARPGADREDAA
jgi:ABC-type multidrug transport system ATPase subunit